MSCENDEICIKNEGFCIKITQKTRNRVPKLLKNERFCIRNDEFCRVCVLFYTPVGILGYYTFGTETLSDILDNFGKVKASNLNHLPDSSDIQLGRLAMAFTTSMSFPIMTYISRLAIFDILKIKDITALKPRMAHAAIQNICVPAVCIMATKAGLDLGFFIGLLGCSACVIVQLFFPGLMAIKMGNRVCGYFLVVLSVLQFTLGMFLVLSGQHCKDPVAAVGDFCVAVSTQASHTPQPHCHGRLSDRVLVPPDQRRRGGARRVW